MASGDRDVAPERSSESAELTASVLGLMPGASEDTARATILTVLSQASFVPDSRTHAAIAISSGRTPAPDSELGAELVRLAQEPLRARIEEFAATYFTLRPEHRTERWRELWRQSKGIAGAHERLRGLAPGLKLDRSTVRDPSPEVQQLAQICLALFVLAPGARTLRRREELARMRAGDDVRYAAWQRAGRRLRRRYRAIAALVPELLEDLSQPRTRTLKHYSQRPSKAPKSTPRRVLVGSARATSQRRSNRWVWVVAVIAMSNLGRLVSEVSAPQGTSGLSNPSAGTLQSSAAVFENLEREVRARIAIRLKRELENRRISLSDAEINRAVDGLPPGLLTYIPALHPTHAPPMKDTARKELARVLADQAVFLDELTLSEVTHACFPGLYRRVDPDETIVKPLPPL